MNTKKIIFIAILLFFNFLNSQTNIKGKVLNFKKEPIEHAQIFLDTINTGITTNANGDFEVTTQALVKNINVYTQEYGLLTILYNGEDRVNFIYLESKKMKKTKKDEKIQIGYSTVDQKFQVNKIETLEVTKNKDNTTYNTIYDMIRGRLSGVIVQPDNSIIIRGISSIKNNSEPLFVVDGSIVSSIDYLVPMNVKTISVLKGAEASIYGSQGSSGVILITTKN